MTTPMLSSLSGAQMATIEAVETPTPSTFPRAENAEHGPGYYRLYALDCRALMRAWLIARLAGFIDLFDLTYQTEADATMTARPLAAREVSRDLNDNERSLIASVVRELVVARAAMQNHERALVREVL